MTIEQIMEAVCQWYGVTSDDVRSRTVRREVVGARHEIWFLCCLKTFADMKEIAALTGTHRNAVTKAVTKYTGPDHSYYLVTGQTPPRLRRISVKASTRYCRTYLERLKEQGRYGKYLERRRQRYHERARAHV